MCSENCFFHKRSFVTVVDPAIQLTRFRRQIIKQIFLSSVCVNEGRGLFRLPFFRKKGSFFSSPMVPFGNPVYALTLAKSDAI